MVSDFRKKKLLYVHSFFDKDGSGSLEKKDFEQAAEYITKVRGWKQEDYEYKETFDTLLKVWDAIESVADANKDGVVTFDEWISMWDSYAKDSSHVYDWQKLYCKFIFQIQDACRDGAIDSEEFSAVSGSFGINKDEAVSAFQKMSKGNPIISWQEFQELWKEYFASDDPNAPGNLIFGTSTF